MTLTKFLQESDFANQNELRRVLLLAFYYLRQGEVKSFTLEMVSEWLIKLGYAKPNGTRLRERLRKSKLFVSAGSGSHRIHPSGLEALDMEFPGIEKQSEEIVSLDSIVPENLLQKKRSFILSLIRQVNSSYENNIFDGCAVLMRRLLEILLVLSYEKIGIEEEIQDDKSHYKNLNSIIDNAITNKALGLSRNTKDCLGTFRKLGNFSAHKIFYNANKKSIELVILDYRAAIEELLYKSELRE